MYLVQAFLTTFAILAVLVGVKTIPLSYVIMSLNITHLAFNCVDRLFSKKMSDTHTMLSLLFAMITVVCGISSVQLMKMPVAKAALISSPGLKDPFIQIFISADTIDNLSDRQVFLVGLWTTITAGFCFSIVNKLKGS